MVDVRVCRSIELNTHPHPHPDSHDPARIVWTMARKQITLYTVAVEPSIGRLEPLIDKF
jgi:hypothetical protein